MSEYGTKQNPPIWEMIYVTNSVNPQMVFENFKGPNVTVVKNESSKCDTNKPQPAEEVFHVDAQPDIAIYILKSGQSN